jgi:hypothetical protein
LHEQNRLFEGGKVAAFVQLVPIDDVGIGLLRPGAWWPEDFLQDWLAKALPIEAS